MNTNTFINNQTIKIWNLTIMNRFLIILTKTFRVYVTKIRNCNCCNPCFDVCITLKRIYLTCASYFSNFSLHLLYFGKKINLDNSAAARKDTSIGNSGNLSYRHDVPADSDVKFFSHVSLEFYDILTLM